MILIGRPLVILFSWDGLQFALWAGIHVWIECGDAGAGWLSGGQVLQLPSRYRICLQAVFCNIGTTVIRAELFLFIYRLGLESPICKSPHCDYSAENMTFIELYLFFC